MATPYSTRFADLAGLNGAFTYNVPEAFRLVLRDVDVYGNAGLSAIHFRILNPAGGTIWLFQVDTDTNASGQWRGRQVYNAGEAVTFTTDGAMDVTASGYLLNL